VSVQSAGQVTQGRLGNKERGELAAKEKLNQQLSTQKKHRDNYLVSIGGIIGVTIKIAIDESTISPHQHC